MNNEKFNSLKKMHLVLMILLCAVVGASLAFIVIKGISLPSGVMLMHIVLFISLLCGLVYVMKGYQKSAAIYYKAFISIVAISDVILIATTLSTRGFNLDIVVLCARAIILLILAFGKDLGKKNTWTLYYIGFAISLLYGILFVPRNFHVLLVIADSLGRLIIDGTIGLSVYGKYADKEERKTV